MIIGVSGMISAGKSTLIEGLKNAYPNSLFLAEYDQDDEIFNTFLKWFYEKKEHLTMAFQTYVVESHSAKFHKIVDEFKSRDLNKHYDYVFLDRFAIEHYIFAYLNLKPAGKKYLEAYDSLFSKMIFEDEVPDYVIYLNISFNTFKDRILKRGREVEIENFETNYQYFKELHDIYQSKFEEMARKYKIPYTIIETDEMTNEQVLQRTQAILKIVSDAQAIKNNDY